MRSKEYLTKVFFCSILLSTILAADAIPPRNNSSCIDFDSRYVYIGTRWGLSIYDKEQDRWCDPPLEIAEKKTIADIQTLISAVLAILSDSELVWIGHHFNGVYRFVKRSGELEHWRNEWFDHYDDRKIKYPLPSNTVNSIKKDGLGNIFFATPDGIAKFYDNEWEIFQIEAGKLEGNPTSLDIDDANRLWVGLSNFYYAYYEERAAPSDERDVGGGVQCFDGEKWKHFYAYNYNLGQEDSLHRKTSLITNKVACIANDGNLVLVGSDLGLSIYDSKTDSWRNQTKEDWDMLRGVGSIAVTQDYLWVGSSTGMLRYDKRDSIWSVPYKDNLPSCGIASIAYDPYDESIWAVTRHYARTDVYIYRYRNGELTIYPTRKRIITENAEELFQLGVFLKHIAATDEARIVFAEFMEKYPNDDKVEQVEKALSDIDEYDRRH